MAKAKRPPKASSKMKANAARVLGGSRDSLGSSRRNASQPKGFSGGKYSNRIRRDSKGRFT